VVVIINTHSHPDHCQANELLVKRSERGVTLSEEEDGFRKYLREQNVRDAKGEGATICASLLSYGGESEFGCKNKMELQVPSDPGSFAGSICLYRPRDKILITGDVVFYGSMGRTDFVGGSLSALKKSIDRLSQLDVDCLVPGHSTEYGNVVKGKIQCGAQFSSSQTAAIA